MVMTGKIAIFHVHQTLMFCGLGIGSIVAAIIMSIVSLFVLGGVVVGVLFMLNVISNMLK